MAKNRYVIPQKRKVPPKPKSHSPITQSDSQARDQKDELKYTSHGLLRSQQREIHQSTIVKTLNDGEKSEQEKGIATYINEDTKLVVVDNKVVTVIENTRNTKWDLLHHTKTHEKKLIRKATFQNNDHAMCELADYYLEGKFGPINVQKAYEWLLRAANTKNNSHAMCKLSQLHESGKLGVKDPDTALNWMEKAAQHGNNYASAILGQRFLAKYQAMCEIKPSSIIEQDKEQEKIELREKSQNYLLKAANKNNTRAMWQMANIYEEGLLGEKNLPKAIELYVKAAKLGSPSSLASLNELVKKGEFKPEEFEIILDHASELLARTSSQLATEIGLEQIEGLLGKNPQRGFFMLEKAAEKGNQQALIALFKCYRDGKGCKPNQELSRYWINKLKELYEKAAEKGNVTAMWDLGRLFLKGSLGDIDLSKAEATFIKAAMSGDPVFAYRLGKLYINGCLGNKDPSESIIWFEKAITIWSKQALARDNEAALCLGERYFNGGLGGKDYNKALYWLTLAADKGNVEAMMLLVKLYLKDNAGHRNVGIAVTWLEKVLLQIDKLDDLHIEQEALTLLNKLWLEKNLREALPWLLEKSLNGQDIDQLYSASELTHYTGLQTHCMLQLARIYKNDNLEVADYAKAVKLYSLLARVKHLRASVELAEICQSRDLGNILDQAEQARLAQLLVTNLTKDEAKNTQHALILAKLYKNGNFFPKDIQAAAKWFCLASLLAQSDKEYQYANKEFCSLLSSQELSDEEKSQILQELLNLAQQFGDEIPRFRVISRILGDIYSEGILIEHDYEQAISWYERSASVDNAKAMCKLGNIYETGALGKADLFKAIEWYILSAKLKNEDAKKSLTKLLELTNLEPNLRSTIEQWQKSQEEHHLNIETSINLHPNTLKEMYELGKKYYNPTNSDKEADYLHAALWFRKAAQYGYEKALFKLAMMYDAGQLGEKLRPVAVTIFSQALKCYKLILKTEEKSPHGKHLTIAKIWDKMGIIYNKLGNITESLKYQEKALKIKEEFAAGLPNIEPSFKAIYAPNISNGIAAQTVTHDITALLGNVEETSTSYA